MPALVAAAAVQRNPLLGVLVARARASPLEVPARARASHLEVPALSKDDHHHPVVRANLPADLRAVLQAVRVDPPRVHHPVVRPRAVAVPQRVRQVDHLKAPLPAVQREVQAPVNNTNDVFHVLIMIYKSHANLVVILPMNHAHH